MTARARLMRLAAPERRAWSAPTLTGMGLSTRGGGRAQPATPAEAATLSAYHACVRYIAETVSCMAVDAYRQVDGRTVPLRPTPEIVANPSPVPQITAAGWLAQVISSARARGNAFGLITQVGPSGWPTKIDTLDPACVSYQAGEWRIHIAGKATTVELWQNGGTLWHVPFGLEAGQVIGIDIVSRAAIDLGLARAARQYGADFYWSGGHPTAVLESDSALTGTQAKDMQQRWMDAVADGGRAPRVLGLGLRYRPLQITPDQASLLGALQASTADVCRWFDVPPEEIGASSGDSLTYANVEGRSLQALRKLTPTIRAVQDAWSALLPDHQVVRLTPETLLMTNAVTKQRIIADNIRVGLMTINEGRQLLDLAPVPGADELLWPPYRAFPVQEDSNA